MDCVGGNAAACERRNELNKLDHERDLELQVSCSVGSPASCQEQLELAQANYDSYDGNVSAMDDHSFGEERMQIDKLLMDYAENYPEWDVKGMKEFGYDLVSTPEGVMVCMGMTLSGCAPLASFSSFVTGAKILNDLYHDNGESSKYDAGAFITGEFIDRAILNKVPVLGGDLGEGMAA